MKKLLLILAIVMVAGCTKLKKTDCAYVMPEQYHLLYDSTTSKYIISKYDVEYERYSIVLENDSIKGKTTEVREYRYLITFKKYTPMWGMNVYSATQFEDSCNAKYELKDFIKPLPAIVPHRIVMVH